MPQRCGRASPELVAGPQQEAAQPWVAHAAVPAGAHDVVDVVARERRLGVEQVLDAGGQRQVLDAGVAGRQVVERVAGDLGVELGRREADEATHLLVVAAVVNLLEGAAPDAAGPVDGGAVLPAQLEVVAEVRAAEVVDALHPRVVRAEAALVGVGAGGGGYVDVGVDVDSTESDLIMCIISSEFFANAKSSDSILISHEPSFPYTKPNAEIIGYSPG